MEPIRLWRTTEGDWRKTNGGAFNVTEYAALTRADFDALAAEAADARTLRAERDSLVKERDTLREREAHFANALGVCDGGRYRNDWDAAIRRVIDQRNAATARADKAEALLREARDSVERDYFECDTRLTPEARKDRLARIDALLEGK